jgi:hypothetical protein
LADANLVGHFEYVLHLLDQLGLAAVLEELPLQFSTIADAGLAPDIDDRSLWHFCQEHGWVLFTENRNADGADSLQATIADSWRSGDLPVLTLANKIEFEHNPEHRQQVATELAELLFGISLGDYCDECRIYVPRLPENLANR